MTAPKGEPGWKERLAALGVKRTRRRTPAVPAVRTTNAEDGRRGEEAAARLLEANGLTVAARNVRFPDGELDLVALDGPTVVFVEVKWRRTAARGAPAEAVTPRKRARVVLAARRWLAASPTRYRAVRFDVVALTADPPVTDWIRGAFDAT